MEGFSTVADPLTTLTKKKVKFECPEKYEKSFQDHNDRLTLALVITLARSMNGTFCIIMISK